MKIDIFSPSHVYVSNNNPFSHCSLCSFIFDFYANILKPIRYCDAVEGGAYNEIAFTIIVKRSQGSGRFAYSSPPTLFFFKMNVDAKCLFYFYSVIRVVLTAMNYIVGFRFVVQSLCLSLFLTFSSIVQFRKCICHQH